MAAALLVALATLGLVACQRDVVPPLVEVTEISPREIEVGDRLELRGGGYPQGRPAHLTFRGTIHRPGDGALSGVSIDADGTVTGADRVELPVTDALEERFCGRGDSASHATFRGDVDVAFSSNTPGAPPLVGVLHGVVLDVRPASVRATVLEAHEKEGTRVLSFLGVLAGPSSSRGIPVEGVTPGSPADRAGIQAGDVLSEIDGVRVAHVSDFIPSSSRATKLVVRRGDTGVEDAKSIPMIGYATERIPVEYAPALLVVGLALAALVLLVLPAPTVLGAVELRIASRLRTTTWSAVVQALAGKGAAACAFGLASILLSTFALGPHVIAAELDAAVLLVCAIALVLTSRVMSARGFVGSSVAAAKVLGIALVLAVSVVGVVVATGALSLSEIVRAQGGAPWQFGAAHKPATFLLALAYLGALFLLVRPSIEGPVLALTLAPPKAAAGSRARGAVVLERLGLLVACALGVAVFFGGWQLPGAGVARSLGLQLLAAVVFVVKTWALVAVLRGAASIASPWTTSDARSFVLRRLVPVLFAGALAVVGSRRLAPMSPSLELAAGAAMAFAIALLAVRSMVRVRGAMLRPEPHASPFL
ncbi:PDZ domain-containing protein [Labilithrix luteola]|nr:PDZ domain-containing protein [Labilithrix luteola]